MWLRRVVAIAFGLALGVATLGLGELAARRFDPPGPADFARAYNEWAQGPCYRVDGNRLIRVSPPSTPGPNDREEGPNFPLSKPPGVRRIAVVGESTGAMLEGEIATLVNDSGCADRIEVLRCSATGAPAEVAVRRAEEVLAYSPDVIVVAIGHNFMLPYAKVPPPNLLDRSRLAGEVRKWIPLPPPHPTGEPDTVIDAPMVGRRSYEKIFTVAKPHGVQVVALLLASNFWLRPTAETGYLDSPERAAAWVKWARDDLNGAVAAIAPVNGLDGPVRAFERATLRTLANDWTPIRHELGLARDLDAFPTRASAGTTTAIAMAAQKGGATIVDAETLLSQSADHQIPGWDVFFDNCHPRAEPLNLLARAVLSSAAPRSGCRISPPERSTDTPSADDLIFQLRESKSRLNIPNALNHVPPNDDLHRVVDGAIAALIRSGPKESLSVLQRFDAEDISHHSAEVRAAVLDTIGEAARNFGKMDIARWATEKSVEAQPTAASLVNLALLRLHAHNEEDAKAQVEKAVALDPSSVWARNVRDAMANR